MGNKLHILFLVTRFRKNIIVATFSSKSISARQKRGQFSVSTRYNINKTILAFERAIKGLGVWQVLRSCSHGSSYRNATIAFVLRFATKFCQIYHNNLRSLSCKWNMTLVRINGWSRVFIFSHHNY